MVVDGWTCAMNDTSRNRSSLFPPTATWAFLIITNMLTAALGTVLAGRAVEALLRAERATFAQAWRLRQFLPEIRPEETRRAR